jgi:hypothetical protein
MPQIENLSDYVMSNGKLRSCTDVGCYDMFYMNAECEVFCPACANELLDEITHAEVNWESLLYCDECSEQIPASYGVYDEDEDEDEDD